MTDDQQANVNEFSCAAIFGASGGIGRALTENLANNGVTVWAGSRSGNVPQEGDVRPFAFDLNDEATIEQAASLMQSRPPQLIIAATGVLTLADGTGPERSYRGLRPDIMAQVMALNTIGPAMIAKHMLPLLDRHERGVFAAISARVGSISDNGLGGWHSYRASKAALNMLIKNFAIELRRTHKQAVVAGLHPGTVDSELSKPFQGNLPEGQLTDPAEAAQNLLAVLRGLTPDNSGEVFDFAGKRIPS
ncbi:SDR family NAD(P)-dependent oxidoreductase [Pontixanthobacter luteolus]|uniref:SDR family NAD(P)-dependent oxidoreductase n=1 Tax=Pontixanthobacter luteolus TaxID=295089 RepID=UPI00230402D4|nr:SDR family NAD(P)-dependent oxidoreductase [Pontixanthobacter luteolus]